MSFLRNRHVVVAMIVAPILALVAWFGVDHFFGERPQPAVAGNSYALAEQPGCRYAGGACGLKNADFELRIAFQPAGPDRVLLQVDSEFPLDVVVAARVSPDGREYPPRNLRRTEPDGRSWTIELPAPRVGEDRLRIAASAAGVEYFGEVATRFGQAEDAAE